MRMGCTTSTSQPGSPQTHHNSDDSKLEQQVVDLEREVQKQKELRIMYRKRMERTQDYLKYCLQIAQDHGFLNLIMNRKDEGQETSFVRDVIDADASPPLPAPRPQHSDLSALVDQAKMNGWYIHHEELELLEKIGQGTTAEIYQATWRGTEVGVKCLSPDFFTSNDNGVAFFAQEVQTLSRQRHRFVLQLMGACLDPPNHAWVVTELLGVTLKEWMHGFGGRKKERVVPLPPLEERLSKAVEIAQAMQYLHEQRPKLVHRDLKPSNIFLDDADHIRVADFGHARLLHDHEMALTGETGTFVYMAPEVIRCEPYNEKCDVYSFAVILNELITGQHPYIETDSGPSKIAMEVAEGKLRPELPLPEDNDQFEDLIKLTCLCWDQDPTIRPSFGRITCALLDIQRRILETTVN